MEKGIYASLQMLPLRHAFFDPAKFISLLGAIEDQLLPVKIGAAFVFVGNAVAVPHAMLGLLVALQAISEQRIDIIHPIRHAWLQKLTAHNALALQIGEWVHIIHHERCYKHFHLAPSPSNDGPNQVIITITQQQAMATAYLDGAHTLRECLNILATAPTPLVPSTTIHADGHPDGQAFTLTDAVAITPVWTFSIARAPIACDLCQQPEPKRPKHQGETLVISPTIPFSAHVQPTLPLQVPQPCFEQIVTRLHQLRLQELLTIPLPFRSGRPRTSPYSSLQQDCLLPVGCRRLTIPKLHRLS